jgi:hypothetical protein
MSEQTITINDVEYDVDSLSNEARLLISFITEIQAERQVLDKRSSVLAAALVTFESKLVEELPQQQEEATEEE